jgi:hypothetical protein
MLFVDKKNRIVKGYTKPKDIKRLGVIKASAKDGFFDIEDFLYGQKRDK